MSERVFRGWVLRELKKNKYTAIGLVGGAFQKSGLPDLLVIGNGRLFFIELKNPNGKGKVSSIQRHMINLINANGCEAFIVSSKDELKKILKKYFISDNLV